MAYKSIHTTYGLREIARAIATGSQTTLVAMAVGDGGGNQIDPNVSMTTLKRERWRGAISRVYQDPDDETIFIAEAVIPTSAGGWTVREAGLIDANGNLYTVANLPASYKPLPTEGTAQDIIMRIAFQPGNAQTVTLQIDPNVAIATQSWVINYAKPANLFPGGTMSQILVKKSNADGDADWDDPDGINVTVDTIEETQTLAASQTVVDLTVTTTRGLALYVDGVRLRNDEWTKDPDLDLNTRLHLVTSYPAGTKLTAAQNDPTGSAGAPLERAKNLSDLQSAPTARTNLGVYSKEETRQMAPSGMVAPFARTSPPNGWLRANGAAVSRTAYADLFAAIGTTFGAGDGFNTFNVPNLRGEFIRGLDDGRGVDSGRTLGSWQAQQVQRHKHVTPWGEAWTISNRAPFGATNNQSKHGSNASDSDNYWYHTNDGSDYDGTVNAEGVIGSETRPRNVALLYCIKF